MRTCCGWNNLPRVGPLIASSKEGHFNMAGEPGETEQVGGSGEKKARNVGGFVGILLGAIVLVLLLVIGYLALRREKAVPTTADPTTQPAKQSRAEVLVPYRYA